MKRFVALTALLILVACNSTADGNIAEEASTTTSSTSTTINNESTDTTIDSNVDTTSNTEIKYVFDVDKMSPFTGKELPPESWLKRPRRVIAFKIDNNINARPQSGLQEADAVHEILVEGGMTNMEAIISATRIGGELLGINVGTIEEGQKADILVIKGDPSKNIKILSDKKNIKVFKDGKLLENSI